MKQGVFTDLSNEQYHASEGISGSGLSLILDCPKRYWHRYLSGKHENKKSKAFEIGTLVHTLVLEPEIFCRDYLIVPRINKAASLTKKIVVNETDYELASGMADAIKNHPRFKFVFKNARVENSLFWEHDGITLRSRPDFYTELLIGDVKTTPSVKPYSFAKSMVDYGYHRQAALAIDGLHKLTGKLYEHFVILAVEKEPPYLCQFFLLDKLDIEIGRKEYLSAAATYKTCLEKNEWPDYGTDIQDINLPTWYK